MKQQDPSQVRRLRLELGMTQEELAEKLMVSNVTVCRWETHRTRPHRAFLAAIQKLRDVFPGDNDVSTTDKRQDA